MEAEPNTKHKKFAIKVTPAKSKHKHEYVSYYCTRVPTKLPGLGDYRYMKMHTPVMCIDCGKKPKRVRFYDSRVEHIEVSLMEYWELKDK